MSKEGIVERILSDAQTQSESIISAAEKRAGEIIAEALAQSERDGAGVRAEVAERCSAIKSGKAAEARLDSAKILLAEKRKVIDGVYGRALTELKRLKKAEAVALADKILNEFAETGDEIAFAEDFGYAKEVAELDVVKEKKLKISLKADGVNGGFVLRGKTCDKDVSYGALLLADREERQADIAAAVFATK